MEPGLAGLERAFESRSALASGIVKSLQRRRRRLLHLNAGLPMRRVGRQAQVDVFVRRTKRVDAPKARWMQLHFRSELGVAVHNQKQLLASPTTP